MVNLIAFIGSVLLSLAIVYLPINSNNFNADGYIGYTAIVCVVGIVLFFILRALLPKITKIRKPEPAKRTLLAILLFLFLAVGSYAVYSMKYDQWHKDPNRTENILEKIGSDVCSGIAHPELSKYNNDGTYPAYYYGPLFTIYHNVEQKWMPDKNSKIQLVICQTEDSVEKTLPCHYDYMTRNQTPVPNSATDIDVIYVLKSMKIRMVSATDLKEIKTITLDPDMTLECPTSLSIDDENTKSETFTRYVPADNVISAIDKFFAQ